MWYKVGCLTCGAEMSWNGESGVIICPVCYAKEQLEEPIEEVSDEYLDHRNAWSGGN